MKQFILLLLLSTIINIPASFSQKTEKVDQFLLSGQYLEAIPLLHKMIKKDSANSTLYFRLGKAYQKLDQNNRAIDNYTKAKQLRPNSTVHY